MYASFLEALQIAGEERGLRAPGGPLAGLMKGDHGANVVICTVKPNAAFGDGKWE